MGYRREDIKILSLDFADINVGDVQEFRHKIVQTDVDTFASLTGDYNPLHVDKEFAGRTNFRKPVVHGMLTSSFISTMIGTLIPGEGALWSSQTLEFLLPAYIDDEITVRAEVIQKSPATRFIVINVRILNQHGHELVKGEARVKLLEVKKEEKPVEEESRKKTVLVTGASRGIGAAIAKRLAGLDYPVIINYASSEDEANLLAKELGENKHKALALKADIADPAQFRAMIEEGEEKLGPIGSVVHCAAPTAVPKLFADTGWEDFERQHQTQIRGAYNIASTLLPRMVEAKEGSLVFVGSIFSEGVPPTQQAPYTIAKAALDAFSRSLAVEYGPKGIRVNTLSPGMTETDMIANIPEKVKLMTKMQTPLRKLAVPDDIARVASFLVGPDSRHISGENIKVCGGVVM